MQVGVVVFPGSNCDRDAQFAIGEVLGLPVRMLWHKDTDLSRIDAVFIPGGFSYGDYLRSGALASFSPIVEAIRNFVEDGGFALGVCNGFQVLCESGLLPGALRRNSERRFICRKVNLLAETKAGGPLSALRNSPMLQMPIAHAEGSYYAEREELVRMRRQGQILLRYCDGDGQVSEAVNPNGSVDSIAGISSADGHVIGMMPHPERAANPLQGPADGYLLLRTIFNYWSGLR